MKTKILNTEINPFIVFLLNDLLPAIPIVLLYEFFNFEVAVLYGIIRVSGKVSHLIKK